MQPVWSKTSINTKGLSDKRATNKASQCGMGGRKATNFPTSWMQSQQRSHPWATCPHFPPWPLSQDPLARVQEPNRRELMLPRRLYIHLELSFFVSSKRSTVDIIPRKENIQVGESLMIYQSQDPTKVVTFNFYIMSTVFKTHWSWENHLEIII